MKKGKLMVLENSRVPAGSFYPSHPTPLDYALTRPPDPPTLENVSIWAPVLSVNGEKEKPRFRRKCNCAAVTLRFFSIAKHASLTMMIRLCRSEWESVCVRACESVCVSVWVCVRKRESERDREIEVLLRWRCKFFWQLELTNNRFFPNRLLRRWWEWK